MSYKTKHGFTVEKGTGERTKKRPLVARNFIVRDKTGEEINSFEDENMAKKWADMRDSDLERQFRMGSKDDFDRKKLKNTSFVNGRSRGLTAIQNKCEKVGIKLVNAIEKGYDTHEEAEKEAKKRGEDWEVQTSK